jgi:UDP-glucose 4-epimerase
MPIPKKIEDPKDPEPPEEDPEGPEPPEEDPEDPVSNKSKLDWTAERTLDDMCADSYRWQHQNPNGYED